MGEVLADFLRYLWQDRGPKKEKGSGLAQPFGILGPCSWGRRSVTRKGERSHKIHSHDVRESSVCVRDELSCCAT